MNNEEVSTTKLGELKDHPTHKDKTGKDVASSFQFKRRMPGWYPDGYENFWGTRREVFMEEFLKLDKDGIHPFPVPSSSSSALPFTEPDVNASAKDWGDFHKWILGHPISQNTDSLTQICCDLAKKVRKFNAVLYQLRRLHYHENAPDRSPPMPHNPHGGYSPNLHPKDSEDFKKDVNSAESDWAAITKEISEYLASNPQGLAVTADMVEVNGYIVSMRVLGQKPLLPPGTVSKLEVGGSSSHVSISSAFQAVPPP